MSTRRTLHLFVLLAGIAPGAHAQDPLATALAPANGAVRGHFTNVRDVHELANGQVLWSDAMAGIIGVGDFDRGSFQPLQNVTALPMVPLPGDTSVILGLGSGLVFLVGSRPVGMLSRENPVVHAAPWIYGADSFGHFLSSANPKPGEDSIAQIEVDRTTAAQDTVTRIWFTQRRDQLPAFATYEQAMLTLDGWVAVLRSAPYRVDWRDRAGHWFLGAPIPFTPVPVDDREMKFVMAARAGSGTPNAPATLSGWPTTVPPVVYDYPPISAPGGMVLIARTATVDAPEHRYDLVNRHGDRERQVVVPPNQRIIGFGAKSVYTTSTDASGIQTIERHPWP